MRILGRGGRYYTYEDRYGYTLRKEECGESTIEFIEHRVDGRGAWKRLVAPRLRLSDDPAEPARLDDKSYFGHFDPYPSWEGALWRMRGMEALLADLLLEPDWAEEMAGVHVDLAIDTLRRCLEVRAVPDGILWAEDLGCNTWSG